MTQCKPKIVDYKDSRFLGTYVKKSMESTFADYKPDIKIKNKIKIKIKIKLN